jgi:hypothetical protein
MLSLHCTTTLLKNTNGRYCKVLYGLRTLTNHISPSATRLRLSLSFVKHLWRVWAHLASDRQVRPGDTDLFGRIGFDCLASMISVQISEVASAIRMCYKCPSMIRVCEDFFYHQSLDST